MNICIRCILPGISAISAFGGMAYKKKGEHASCSHVYRVLKATPGKCSWSWKVEEGGDKVRFRVAVVVLRYSVEYEIKGTVDTKTRHIAKRNRDGRFPFDTTARRWSTGYSVPIRLGATNTAQYNY